MRQFETVCVDSDSDLPRAAGPPARRIASSMADSSEAAACSMADGSFITPSYTSGVVLVNGAFRPAHTLCGMAPKHGGDTVWQTIDEELLRRKAKHLAPSSWAALGRMLPTPASNQVLTNWKARGVPPKEYVDVAAALGWTVEQLLGKERRTPAKKAPIEPRGNFADRHEVSDSDFALLQAVKGTTTEQWRAERVKQHEELLAQARAQIEAAAGKP